MAKLIARTYRISAEQDKLVKKAAKRHGGESAYLRHLIGHNNAADIKSKS